MINPSIEPSTAEAIGLIAGLAPGQLDTGYSRVPMSPGKTCVSVLGTAEDGMRFRIAADLIIGLNAGPLFGYALSHGAPHNLTRTYWPRLTVKES